MTKLDPQPLQGRKVLLAEDEGTLALELNLLLSDRKATVIGPFSQVAKLHSATPELTGIDVAILDIMLRDGTTLDLARSCVERGIPVVFFTGTPDAAADLSELEAVAICTKPSRPEQVINLAEKLVAKRS